jgi:ADP-dependent NAD(P)H-hydrate dehydratase / NAD(P)H-hydrate epimerase
MIKIVTVEQMREIERAADESGLPYAEMMENAGGGVASVVKLLLGDSLESARVAVLVGPGNNGGDGLVAARILKEDLGIEVGAYLLKSRGDDDQVFSSARAAGVFITNAADDQRWRVLTNLVANADIVIDALLGTGARLPVDGEMLALLEHARQFDPRAALNCHGPLYRRPQHGRARLSSPSIVQAGITAIRVSLTLPQSPPA